MEYDHAAYKPKLLSHVIFIFMFSKKCCVPSYNMGDLNIMLTEVNATTKFQFSQILEVSRALKLNIPQFFKEMFTKSLQWHGKFCIMLSEKDTQLCVWKKLCVWYDLNQLKMYGKRTESKYKKKNVNSVCPFGD